MNDKPHELAPSTYWIKAWEQAMLSNTRTASDEEEEQYWQEHASVYDERNPLAPYTQVIMEQVVADLKPSDHLLEVGPGTGGFTQLLVPYVASITLVEPSAAMYKEFCLSWASMSYPLPKAIGLKWEEAPPLQTDILFSANAVYRIRDMKACLIQMNHTATRHVFLVQSIGRPFAGPLQVELDGAATERERAAAISDILTELGIKHQYRTFPIQRKNGAVHDVALIHWEPQAVSTD